MVQNPSRHETLEPPDVDFNQLVGAASRSLDFVDDIRYKYWFTPTPDTRDQEGLAAMIFALVAFIK